MSGVVHAAATSANIRPACGDGRYRTPVRIGELISSISRKLWPRGTAGELANRADVTVRTAEHWLGGRCGLSADALAELICSDAGLDVLEGIMERRQSKPDWWRSFKRRVRMESLEARLEALQREADELKRERHAR